MSFIQDIKNPANALGIILINKSSIEIPIISSLINPKGVNRASKVMSLLPTPSIEIGINSIIPMMGINSKKWIMGIFNPRANAMKKGVV